MYVVSGIGIRCLVCLFLRWLAIGCCIDYPLVLKVGLFVFATVKDEGGVVGVLVHVEHS